jgi:two-component system, OmpR family, phosphate regulon sensor histidine kinase PhoR
MRVLPRTITGRLLLASAVTLLVCIGTLAALAPVLVKQYEADLLAERLQGEATIVATLAREPLRRKDSSALDALARNIADQAGTRVTLVARDGVVVGESHEDRRTMDDHSGRPEVAEALAGRAGRSIRHSTTVGSDLLYVAVPVRDGETIIGVARVALPVETLQEAAARLAGAVVAAAVAGGLVALGVAFLVARAISRPLRTLASRARSGSIGDWRDGSAPVEVSDLAASLRTMSDAAARAQIEIGAERDRLATVIRELADAVLIVDPEERVRLANARAHELLGAETLLGRRLHEVVRDHEVLDAARRARTEGEVRAVVERSAPARYVHVVAQALSGGDVLIAMQDLSRLRRLESVRRDFVANVSHELRTPISSIKAIVETLEGGAMEDRVAARDFLARMHTEVDGLSHLVSELLSLSRIESGEDAPRMGSVRPADLVDRAVARLRPLADRAFVSLAVAADADLPPVHADAEKIGQVLINLLHNAIKFTPSGGRVDVSATPEDGRVRFSVRDTGAGLAQEELERVFERFYKGERSRAGGGTGLGLAIAKHIVQAHGGAIAAESDGPGRGATFGFTLPVAAP